MHRTSKNYGLAKALGEILGAKKLVITTAESCTGGGIAAAITAVPGSSVWFEQAYITYSNRAKHTMLGVDEQRIAHYGAVSAEVIESMLLGALQSSSADLGVAVSGIAGPGGGSADKPVGTVYMAYGSLSSLYVERCQFQGSRGEIREQTVDTALEKCIQFVDRQSGT